MSTQGREEGSNGYVIQLHLTTTKPDKLPQSAPAQSEAQTGYPRVHITRQAIPGFNEKNTLDKRGCNTPDCCWIELS